MVVAVEFENLQSSVEFLNYFTEKNPTNHVTAFYIKGEIIVGIDENIKLPKGLYGIEIRSHGWYARYKNFIGRNIKVPIVEVNNFVGYVEYLELNEVKNKC